MYLLVGSMYVCLDVAEIVRLTVCELIGSKAKATLYHRRAGMIAHRHRKSNYRARYPPLRQGAMPNPGS